MGDRPRMAIFEKLSTGPVGVNELAKMLPVSRPAVPQHLRVLRDAGLVTDSRAGTCRLYRLDPAGVRRLLDQLEQLWSRVLGAFQAVAEKPAEDLIQGADQHRSGPSAGRRSLESVPRPPSRAILDLGRKAVGTNLALRVAIPQRSGPRPWADVPAAFLEFSPQDTRGNGSSSS
jgi:biotin operon repressor